MMAWLEAIATLASALFTGAALYISLVEHPARMACGVELAATVFAPSYRRAVWMQAGLALASSALAVGIWVARSDGLWLWAALALFSVVPFTLLVIAPTNRRLLSGGADEDPETVRALLVRWGRLHAVRTVLGALATALMLVAMQGWSVGG